MAHSLCPCRSFECLYVLSHSYLILTLTALQLFPLPLFFFPLDNQVLRGIAYIPRVDISCHDTGMIAWGDVFREMVRCCAASVLSGGMMWFCDSTEVINLDATT